jgi:hypothetical protein
MLGRSLKRGFDESPSSWLGLARPPAATLTAAGRDDDVP